MGHNRHARCTLGFDGTRVDVVINACHSRDFCTQAGLRSHGLGMAAQRVVLLRAAGVAMLQCVVGGGLQHVRVTRRVRGEGWALIALGRFIAAHGAGLAYG